MRLSRLFTAARTALSGLVARVVASPAAAPDEPAEARPQPLTPTMVIRDESWAEGEAFSPIRAFERVKPAPGVLPEGMELAMDAAMDAALDWAGSGLFDEGLAFMGYPYLAQLTQRPEYRRPAEILAQEMTRRWIRFVATGDEDKTEKLGKIKAEFERLNVQDLFRQAAEKEGFFGRSHLFIDTGSRDPRENAFQLSASRRKIAQGTRISLKLIEPMWTYPDAYNSTDPLRPDFYKPTSWFVMGKRVHASRLLTFVSRDVPDLLKPGYSFGGISLSQIAKPYIDNWLRTRQSVSDVIHSFSVNVLKTNMASVLTGGGLENLKRRARLFNRSRDNHGLFLIDKDAEDFANVSMPLSGLDHLQAQAQEHMSAVVGIPLIVLLGITPTGLNASSDGELARFEAWTEAQQKTIFGPLLNKLLDIVQISLFGEIDTGIGYLFEPLRVLSDVEKATVRKTEADTDGVLIDKGVISPHESRVRVAADEDSPYHGLDLTEDPEPPQGGDQGGDGEGDDDDDEPTDPSDGGGGQPGGTPKPTPGAIPPVKAAQDGLTLGDRLVARAEARHGVLVAMDDEGTEHWITTKRDTRLLISGGGVVLGGAGGNLNGKVLSPSTKSAPRGNGESAGKSQAAASALQNRNRSSAASVSQMNKIANNPNPRLLMGSPTMADGAPVVTDLAGKGIAKLTGRRDYVVTNRREIPFRYAVVEADQLHASNHADGSKNDDYARDMGKLTAINNGRTAGVIAAYERGNAGDYKKAIAKAEHVHGIPGAAIRKMKAPVLVRVMDSSHVDDHIGDESNSGMTLALSATEQAQNDANRFDPSGIDYQDDGQPTHASVKGFINAMPEAERQSLAPNGTPTKQAIDRMMAATFHAAYGDTELVNLMAQATDPESRNLIGGLSRAAGSMSKLKDAGPLDVRDVVTGAAKQIINAVRSGVSIKKFMKQGDLLTNSAEDAVAHVLAENARSAKTIGERLKHMADFALEQSQREGTDMFGEPIPQASRSEVLETMNHADH